MSEEERPSLEEQNINAVNNLEEERGELYRENRPIAGGSIFLLVEVRLFLWDMIRIF